MQSTVDQKKRRGNSKGSPKRKKKKGTKGLPEELKREMQNINQNLTQMESKFVKKIEVLEKRQRRLKTASKAKGSKKSGKGEGRETLKNGTQKSKTRKVALLQNLGLREERLSSEREKLPPRLPFPFFVDQKVRENFLEEVEVMVEKKMDLREKSIQNANEEKLKKIVKGIEK